MAILASFLGAFFFPVLLYAQEYDVLNSGAQESNHLEFELTQQERDWLRDHAVIRLGVDSHFAPFEWIDENGEYQGMTSDYIHLLAIRLGLKFELIEYSNWQQAVELADKGELDMLADANKTLERELHFKFTDPYINSPIVIISDSSNGYLESLKNLKGQRVVIESDSFMQGILQRNHAQIQLVSAEHELQAFKMLDQGQALAYVGDGISLNYMIQQYGFLNLRYSGATQYSNQHRMAVTHENALLLSILRKTLASIPRQQKDAIHNRWMGIKIEQGIKDETVIRYVLAGLALMLVLLGYTFKLRRSEQARTLSEKKLNDILENIDVYVYLKDLSGHYLYANQKVCDLWDTSMKKIVGAGDEQFFDAETTQKIILNDSRVLEQGETLREEETTHVIQSGIKTTFLSTKLPLTDHRGKIYALLGVSTDITDRKVAELKESSRNRIFELMATNTEQSVILEHLVIEQEKANPGMKGSILLLNKLDSTLAPEVAPHLPPMFVQALDGLKIEDSVGSCGSAAFRNERVITTDISTDPNWLSLRALAEESTLTSCWSQPIRASDGDVLGTLALYHSKIKSPSRHQIEFLEHSAQLAGITIEKSANYKDLLAQKKLLQLLIDEFPDVLVMKDWHGRFTLANRTLANLYNTTTEAMIGKDDFYFTGDKTQSDFFTRNIQEIMTRFETEVVHEESTDMNSGELRYFKSIKKPFRDDTGNLQILVIAQDITDEMRSKHEVEQVNRQLRYVLNATREGVWDWDLKTNRIQHNQQWLQIMGSKNEQGMDSYDQFIARIIPQDQERVISSLKHSIQTRSQYRSEHRRMKLNGEVIWVSARGQVVEWDESGEPTRMVGATEDITERKLAESKIIENEQLLRSSINAIGEAFVIYDADDRLVYFNDQYRQLYTCSAEVIQPGKSFEEILRFGCEKGQYPEAIGDEQAWIEQRLAFHQRGDCDLIQELDDGRWINVRESKTETGYNVGFRIDITELVQAKHNADSANRAKSQFLATMSHEIRTPMNGVLGMTQLLEDTALDDEQKGYLEIIQESGNNLLKIINDILDFSKLDYDRASLESISMNLLKVCRQSIQTMASLAYNKNLKLQLSYAPDCPHFFMGDPSRVRQILLNLIGNAIKFTHDGEIIVSVLSVAVQEDFIDVQICVSDTGIGIQNEAQTLLFEEFSQVNQATTREYGGTGLGLAITRKLVELMGGKISVESRLGEGSRFIVSIPFQQVEAGGTTQNRNVSTVGKLEHRAPLKANILVVEDVVPNQLVARKLIQGFGCQVQIASDGSQAIESWKSGQFDLVFMDCHMPVMDGYEATRQIRELEVKITHNNVHPIPVIALTANSSSDERILCLQAGMNAVITKPFERDQLYRCIQEWCP
jgi:PAS domain S-box-containing protein